MRHVHTLPLPFLTMARLTTQRALGLHLIIGPPQNYHQIINEVYIFQSQ